MALKIDTEVLVVGAGPVGLFTALLLAQKGVRVRIVDEQWRTASRSYALALHPESLRLLGEFGLAADLVKGGHRIHRVALCGEGQVRAEVRLSSLPTEYPFVVVLPQQLLEEALVDALHRKKIEIEWNHRVAEIHQHEDGVSVQIERLGKESAGYSVSRMEWVVEKSLETNARFVIGADGYRSVVRRAVGIDFEEVATPDVFAVFEFAGEALPELSEMQVVLEEESTNVLWPMGGNRFRWSFQIDASDEIIDPRVKSRLFVQFRDESYPFVGEEKLRELMARRAPWFETSIQELFWSAAIRFERRLAKDFRRGRVLLVGDSAHMAYPVGIQSMNIGLREAAALAENVARIVRERASFDLLDNYNHDRLKEWDALSKTEETIVAEPGALPWVKSRASRIPHCLPASGRDLSLLLGQLGLKFT